MRAKADESVQGHHPLQVDDGWAHPGPLAEAVGGNRFDLFFAHHLHDPLVGCPCRRSLPPLHLVQTHLHLSL